MYFEEVQSEVCLEETDSEKSETDSDETTCEDLEYLESERLEWHPNSGTRPCTNSYSILVETIAGATCIREPVFLQSPQVL